ncbi:hypothetical protein BB560_003172 [Smittium megazygosporum]|uniref:HMG box domain-containing protein n=1 Tax=Smittium megazygosporum TaxID=133381 RepID=A0A2T9ZCR2_9FUNG|nr:hypothetical protein BB560_003172 [Smittium megazygosporum]
MPSHKIQSWLFGEFILQNSLKNPPLIPPSIYPSKVFSNNQFHFAANDSYSSIPKSVPAKNTSDTKTTITKNNPSKIVALDFIEQLYLNSQKSLKFLPSKPLESALDAIKNLETSMRKWDKLKSIISILKAKEKALNQKQKIQQMQEKEFEKKLNSKHKLINPPSLRKVTPVNIFIKESYKLANLPEKSTLNQRINVLIDARKKWNQLSSEVKAEYYKKADQENLELIQKAKEWWANPDWELLKLENKRIERINASRKSVGKKPLSIIKNPFIKKRQNNTYAVFTKHMYSKNLVSGEIHLSSKTLSQLWKNLPESEKLKYKTSEPNSHPNTPE